MRDHWNSRLTFILAAVGSAAGLGNIWRFPYLAGKYGSGFILAYFILLFLLGIPLLMMELGIGQRMQKGAVQALGKIGEKFSGIGFGALMVGFIISTYYTVIMAWVVLYFFYSFTLAWGTDTQSFFNSVLQVSSPGVITSITPIVLLALAIVWIIVYFTSWKGIDSISKVIKYIVFVPIILLLIMLLRGLFLPNALAGISHFISFNPSSLLHFDLWMVAAGQIFFSTSIGFGVMIAYASFKNKHSDITKNATIIALSDAFIAFIGSMVVFSTLGFVALQQGTGIGDLAAAGPSLAFVVFPQALNLFPFATIFAVIFFLTLFLLALSSQISMVEAIQTAITDKFPTLSKPRVILGICVACFTGGIIFTTNGGIFILDIVDHFVAEYGLLIVGFLEVVIVGWIFGAEKMRSFINKESEWHVGKIYSLIIKYISPVLISLLVISQIIMDYRTPYESYPSWLLGLFGWSVLVSIIIISVIFSFMQKQKIHKKRTI